MLLYMAAVANRRAIQATREAGVRNYLLSYAGGMNSFDINDDVLLNPQCTLLVDSGAFSAWNNAAEIKIPVLLEFYRALQKRCSCKLHFICLDVIPGFSPAHIRKLKLVRDGRPTPEEREQSAAASWRNWETMRSEGMITVPVYHQHESPKWLEKMAAECSYFGVSPANDVSVNERDEWLDGVYKIIGATRKTHAFGVTATELLCRYPFYSADSSTWLNGAKYGSYIAFIPETANLVQLQRTEIHRHKKRAAADVALFSKDLTYRYKVGLRAFLRYERLVTDLWARRGVVW